MKLFPTLLKATRLTRKGKPISAMLALQRAVLAPLAVTAKRARPKAKPKARAKPVAKPAVPRATPASPPRRAPVAQGQPPGSFVADMFTCPTGELAYRLYTPRGASRGARPLVVMLHGCTQDAADFAKGTGMNELADAHGLLVLYPEQARGANFGRCWNWHRPGDQERGRGEPATIAALTRKIAKANGADPARIYIAGLSAGGATAAIVGAAYPDLFAAVGVHSGLPRGTVTSLSEAIGAMRNGSGERAVPIGRRARRVPMILFHGDRDTVVHPSNASGFIGELRRESRGVLSERTDHGRSADGRRVTRSIYRTGADRVMLESWTIHGGGHGWSGGRPGGSYTDPAGPDASREMVRFFLGQGKPSTIQPSGPGGR